MPAFAESALATTLFLALLLFGHARASRRLVIVAKTLASVGFVSASLAAGAGASDYGRLVLGAQLLSLLGDVLLLGRSRRAFMAGIGAFALAHVAFSSAFLVHGVSARVAAGALIALLAPTVLLGRWLEPHVKVGLRAAVAIYAVLVSLMLTLAVGAAPGGGSGTFALAGILFYVSDVCVARERFVSSGLINRLIGLPLYYAAQLILASTVFSTG